MSAMDSLSDVMSYCRGLEADKITERKKNVEKLRQLLDRKSVVRTLDQNTDDKLSGRNNNRLVTWDDIFKAAVLYVRLETSALQKGKEPQSQSAQNNKEKKKQEVSSFFKFVVRTADKRGARLKYQNLITHILEVLKDEFCCSAYGKDYSSVLLKDVLPVRRYWVEIRSETWHELLHQYCRFFLDPDCTLERVVLARLIDVIVTGASRQCDLHTKKILFFFTEVFKNIRQEKSSQVQEHLLSALNVFVKTIAPSCRVQICKLGEAIFINLLYLWNNRPTDHMKDEIVDFLRIQLQAHHPGGAKSTETGEFAVDRQQWMSHLRKLYELMYTDLHQMSGRNRFSSGTKDAVLKPAYVDLAADVCNQLFTESSQTIEVTQLSLLGDGDHSTPSKKRRLESGWTVVRDNMSSTANTCQVIPWLQVVTRLVEKYPSSVLQEELLPLLQCLHKILNDCKKSDVLQHIFQCLIVTASSYSQFKHISLATIDSTRNIWQSIWSSTLRSMSSHQAEAEGYQQSGFKLLVAMVLQNLASPEKDVWNLFLPNVSSPNNASIHFLSVCVGLHDLPENHQPSILGSSSCVTKGTYPLRKHLLNWILPKSDASGPVSRQTRLDPELTSRVLTSLTVRNPESFLGVSHCPQHEHTTDLEKLYLETTFDRQLRIEKMFETDVERNQTLDVHLLPNLLEVLKGIFDRDAEFFQAINDVNLKISSLHEIISSCCILAKCIQNLLDSGVVSPVMTADTGLELCMKTLLRRMSAILSEFVKKEGHGQLVSVFSTLQYLFPDPDNTSHGAFVVAEMVRSLLPGKFYDVLFEIASSKISRTNSNSSNNSNPLGSLKKRSRYDRRTSNSDRGRARVDDVMDLDFDDAPESSNREEEDEDDMDFDMVDNFTESQESDELNHSDFCQSLVNIASLPESHKLRLEVVRLLCRCCSYERDVATDDVPFKAEVETSLLKNKLEELFEENMFEPGRALDILVLETVVKSFTGKTQKVSDRDLENLVDAIRQVAKLQKRDQEVCCLLLELMTLLVPHLNDPDDLPSKVKKECREITLRLFSAFFKLRDDGHYSAAVRLNIARCMKTFIQCDPMDEWSYLIVKKESTDDNRESLHSEFPNCLLDGCHMTRSYMAQAVHSLFVVQSEKGLQPKPAPNQHQAFDLLYQNCYELMEIKGKMSSEKQQDEILSRTASVLSVLATVACTSSINEKKAMFALCQLIKEKDIEVEKVNKVLKRLSKVLGYRNVQQFVCSHLPFLVNQWLDLDYQLQEFPHRLLACDNTSQFYSEHKNTVVPALFMHRQLQCIQMLAAETGEDYKEVLKLCTPKIVVHILPLFAASKSDEVANDKSVRKRLVLATKCYDVLVKELTNEVKDRIIHSNLDMIVVNVLMCLHGSVDDGNSSTSCRPDPNPPSYNSYIIRSTLDYLTQSSSGNHRSLVSVLSKTPSSIQRVLLELSSSLSVEHRIYEKQRILAMYQLFVEMLLPEFGDELGGSWVFVLRDVIHRLIQVIADIQAKHRDIFVSDCEARISMTEACLELLRKVCTVGLECCHEELAKYLDCVVSCVLPFLKQSGPLQEKSQSLLNLLLLENATLLKTAISRLDPFPDYSVYRDYKSVQTRLVTPTQNQSLFGKLETWLYVLMEKQTETCSETLKSLGSLITDNRRELVAITSRPDAEGRKVICQLVCELLHLTQSSCHQVALNAASCLGIIGPINLSTLSLPRKCPQSGLQNSLTAYEDEPVNQNYCWIFHKLNEYLLDPSISVVKTAGNVLRSVLSTKTGVEFSMDYKTRLADKDYLFSYLHPFRSKKPSTNERSALNLERFFSLVNSDILWIPEHSDHNLWVTDVTCSLLRSTAITDEVLGQLTPICMIKPNICELVLPFLVHNILLGGTDEVWQVLSNQISRFFNNHCEAVWGQTAELTGSELGNVCTNKDSVKTMLNIVQFLRQQERPRKGRKVLTPWDNNFWLDLNYLEMARAAQYCSAPFTAILYSEIWSNIKRDDIAPSSSSSSRSQGQSQESQELRIDTLSCLTPSSIRLNIQELLLEAYESVSDPDGVYGCGAGRLADQTSRIKTYRHENRLDKAVVTCDLEMRKGTAEQELRLLKTVQEFGADHLLALCLQAKVSAGNRVVSPELQEIQYEAAWRTGQWNLDVPSRQVQGKACFHQSLYCAMEALKDKQMALAKSFIDTARQSSLQLIDTRPESCRSIYPILSRLHSLFHLQQIVQAVDSKEPESFQCLLESMSVEEEETNEFEFVQPVLDVKLAALKLLAAQNCDVDPVGLKVLDVLRGQQYRMAKFARKSGKYQIAERIVSELKQDDTVGSQLELVIEEAKLYWARDEHNIAQHLMKSLIAKLEKLLDESLEAVRLLPQALGTYGSWLAETRTENPTVIIENFLEKTVELLENDDDDLVEAYMSLAQFVDTQYQNIVNYMKSSTFEAKQALMKKAKMDAQSVREHLSQKDLGSRYLRALDKQGEIDEREVESLLEDRQKFLLKAVENYIKCLRSGDKHDLRIYRLMSLWFDNASSEEVNQLINIGISEMKTYKFLPLMYQLAARMSVKSNHCHLFQPTLNKILEMVSVDHPHHTVSVVMALAHANKDMELLTQGRSNKRTGRLSRTMSETDSQEEDRVQAAKNLIERLKTVSKVSQIVRNMEVLSVAYIQLANTNVDKYKKETKPIQLPASLMISQIKNLTTVALPTLEAKVDPTCQYKDIVSIAGFENTFRLAGGINLPKILTIIGSDGVHRRQLVKGRDDLRQDAVMQQVFGMVNSLLKKNPETKKRNLCIRMYKVIPLSQRSGVLEWCEGTQPLGEYLIGSSSVKGAHPKYRPQDISAGQCREIFGGIRGEPDLRKKLKAYKEVCDKFKPVFRHFFMERFSEPAIWFERRLAYTRSVATNSIVGYILGLGDRHVMNILIDRNSAELVHIDLGIAFEQGKILPTPETVPFRLTRDIVDGMGVTGVEGVFRRCCEKMMEVMHTNQESLMMILQVLLYDPLYAWSLTPQQALLIQNKRGREDPDATDLNATANEAELAQQTERSTESQESVNKMAERVLLRLQQKLQGIEDGIQLSVSGQVNNLIQEARDPDNLCRLFVGWQPYL